jgi:hypothetical protein
LKAAFEFLMKVERSRRVTELAVAALAQAGGIQATLACKIHHLYHFGLYSKLDTLQDGCKKR